MWYDSPANVTGLGNALTEAEFFDSATDYNNFVRKPNQYTEFYDAWAANGFPESEDDDGWDAFVELLPDDDSDDSDESNETS